MMDLDAGNKDFISYRLKGTDDDSIMEVVIWLSHRWGLVPESEDPSDEEWAVTTAEVYGLLAAVKAGITDGSITAGGSEVLKAAANKKAPKLTDADRSDMEMLAAIQGAMI
jgi:hypothetical protein